MKYSLAVFLLLGSSTLASAQTAEFSLSVGRSLLGNPSLGTLVTGGATPSQTTFTDGFHMGFRITLNTLRFFGHEVGYAYNRTHLQLKNPTQDLGGMAGHQGFYDFLVYALPEGSKFRPFAAGGVQFTNFVPPGSSASQGGGSNKFGINYGGGLKYRVTQTISVRGDLRQYVSGKPFGSFLKSQSGVIRQTEISAGVAFTL